MRKRYRESVRRKNKNKEIKSVNNTEGISTDTVIVTITNTIKFGVELFVQKLVVVVVIVVVVVVLLGRGIVA